MNSWRIKARLTFLRIIAIALLSACISYTQLESTLNTTLVLKAVPVNNATLHYFEGGQAKQVVFVHGAVGDYRTWDGQIEAFSN